MRDEIGQFHAAKPDVPLLEVKNISKGFSGVSVLKDINFTLKHGEVLALVGENGAGKSTLIRILSGALQPDGGHLNMDGNKVRFHSPLDAERQGIVTVYQEFNLFSHLTVAENLLFNQYSRNGMFINWNDTRRIAQGLLSEFGVNISPDTIVSDLSIAEKQMLEILKALHRNARILILDEPTAVLGGDDVDELLKIVKQLQSRGVAVIFISHRLNEIFGLADRYVVLKDGEFIKQGGISQVTPDDLVQMMVGRAVYNQGITTIDCENHDELLRVEELSTKDLLRNINFNLQAGEVLAFAGLRGAGRTEVARAIFGADPITQGKIYLYGREVKIKSPRIATRHGIGLVPEDRGGQGLFKQLSVRQNMFISSFSKGGIRWINHQTEKSKATGYVEKLHIRLPGLGAFVGNLSGGNQQKVVLAKWLEAGVKLLILDEPTRGIDVGSREQIYELIRSLCASGIGIILISSDLTEVLALATRIIVMHKGQITKQMSRLEATEEKIMTYAVGGEIYA